MRTGEDIESQLIASGALLRGHFQLSSGLHSPGYVQCALLLEQPARARRAGEAIAVGLRTLAPRIDSVLSPALGGVVIGHEVAAALGVPFRFAERQGERLALRRGFALAPGEKVVVVEDVVTTGKSTLETAALAAAAGAEVVGIGAIIDRSGGRHGFGVPFAALLALELPTWKPEECPLCRDGGTAVKPGSRPAANA
ncbi:MAG: orotate phosphoribosyltransferase [Thermoanaerobaculia bacterium]|nr:MAG: orotate phosphoribosyltransferase [Thermoanaerobaculia bacterium]